MVLYEAYIYSVGLAEHDEERPLVFAIRWKNGKRSEFGIRLCRCLLGHNMNPANIVVLHNG